MYHFSAFFLRYSSTDNIGDSSAIDVCATLAHLYTQGKETKGKSVSVSMHVKQRIKV